MRRITLVFASTVAVVVLLFSYRTSGGSGTPSGTASPAGILAAGPVTTGAPPAASPPPQPPSAGGGAPPAPTGAPTAASPPPRPPTLGPATPKPVAPVVINGAGVQTDYGPVQVQITLNGGKITAATAVVYPQQTSRDQRINAQAIPILQSETLAAQSAHIDAVSGASYTSQGYATSLQSALDLAHR